MKPNYAKFTIKVTRDVIARGEPGEAEACAIALAVNEQLQCSDARVAEDEISFGAFKFPEVPKRVLKFIEAFDRLGTLRREIQGLKETLDSSELGVVGVKATNKALNRAKKTLDRAVAELRPFAIEFHVPACGTGEIVVKK